MQSCCTHFFIGKITLIYRNLTSSVVNERIPSWMMFHLIINFTCNSEDKNNQRTCMIADTSHYPHMKSYPKDEVLNQKEELVGNRRRSMEGI